VQESTRYFTYLLYRAQRKNQKANDNGEYVYYRQVYKKLRFVKSSTKKPLLLPNQNGEVRPIKLEIKTPNQGFLN
jgi:hypothetical protein